ncbi:NitT/TauT family transport system permease protein [Pseudobutyrivibrio xylanivorans]|uniref:NitT/TauT family transport system permease protein n=1 Tax=Pseudobutyrivibrio xylanivorans TaxID=185007 RepID=A0A1G5S2M2_PSEXY|nr:NitT/TauT family transport system permease protein [Pseudobutyrivibrio xylanivorans]
MNSTTSKNKKNLRLWAVIFWIIVWQLLSIYLDSDILLASPIKVLKSLVGMLGVISFWQSILFTFIRIFTGLIIANVLGVVFAAISCVSTPFKELISVPVAVIKSTPVASFIILVLIWIPSRNLSVFIAFLMAFPVIYTNILQGLTEMDGKMLQMAQVFKIPFKRKLRFIYVPEVIPYYRAAANLSNGLSFKAGIAAEIIGLPRGSIGERLYEAKIYLNTPELFAWTIVIIVLSIVFNRAFSAVINLLMNKLEGR